MTDKHTTVGFSELGSTGPKSADFESIPHGKVLGSRMDACFHIERQRLMPQADILAGLHSPEDAVALLQALTLADRKTVVEPFRRGSQSVDLNQKQIESLENEYPYLCLARMKELLPSIIERQTSESERLSRSAGLLMQIQSSMGPS